MGDKWANSWLHTFASEDLVVIYQRVNHMVAAQYFRSVSKGLEREEYNHTSCGGKAFIYEPSSDKKLTVVVGFRVEEIW